MTDSSLTQYVKRAFEYKAAGNFKQAIENLYKAWKLNPKAPKFWLKLRVFIWN